MSEQNNNSDISAATQDAEVDVAAVDSVKRGGQVIGVVILLSLVWYLLSDRFTPYTDQARVQGYVVAVAPKAAGLVTKVWVTNNQQVEANQPLFQLDPSQYEIALAKSKSDLETARRQVGAGSASVDSARANWRAAQANEDKARKNADRLERLHQEDSGTISTRQLEVAQANLDTARAQVKAAFASIQGAIEQMGGNDEAQNNILITAMTAVEKAELDLANTVVRASSTGIITDLRTDVGNYAGIGKPVMTLVSINDVWIKADFTENNLGHLGVGTPVEILFDAIPGEVFPGKVRSIGLGVSDGQPTSPGTLPTISNNRDWLRQSQRFPVIIGFDAAEPTVSEQLRVGGQVSVIAYSEDSPILGLLGKAYIRLMSWFSYAY
ncbi:MAG: multidrug resistance efflux pump [Oceanicoccus sp.]|jgi:multidrug resistance efflux pump